MNDKKNELDWIEGMMRVSQFHFPESGPFVSNTEDEPDGMVDLGWDQNKPFPAYRVTNPDGSSELVPFTPLAQTPPEGYLGDFYVDEFTDAAIKRRWKSLRDRAAMAQVFSARDDIAVPHQFRATGTLDPHGRINPEGDIDLGQIRSPSYFGQAPYNEPIAQADHATSVVEFTVPREPHETQHMGLSGSIKLRGWHLHGRGVPDGKGGTVRALVVVNAGRTMETTAIQQSSEPPIYWESSREKWVINPTGVGFAQNECWGLTGWRTNHILAYWQAGFDVLTFDKRGHGISGGQNDSNTNEQAQDIFRALDALETGSGLRILTPQGDLLEGDGAAGRLLGGYDRAKDVPVIITGASQGCMITSWAMHKNFVGGCDFERGEVTQADPLGYNIRAAILFAPFPSGLGYRASIDSLVEASRRLDLNVQMFLSSEILATIDRWPGVFIGRGLWDYSESLEGSLEIYRRAKGPKAFVTVRGPHSENEWGPESTAYMRDHMVKFALNILSDQAMTDLPQPASLREAVENAPPYWSYGAQLPDKR
ncbi:MAG: hypothetical protein RIB57_04885 [Pelagibacterium sp.]|uniref:hypothetical protein n=1 Tax=Pelagibacterium sp. TaxID=1967288 RepID=UPI0032EBED22